MAMFMGKRHDRDINTALRENQGESFIAINEGQSFIADMGALAKMISDRVRQRMAALGLTQADLARKIGYSPQRLGNYIHETTPREPDVESLVKIARALDTTVDWLLGFSEGVPPETESAEVDVHALVQRLLELDGMAPERASVIAQVVELALQALAAVPPVGDARTRALVAAQIAWKQKPTSKPS